MFLKNLTNNWEETYGSKTVQLNCGVELPALVLIPCISGFNLYCCAQSCMNVQDFLTGIILRWYFTQTPGPRNFHSSSTISACILLI